MNGLQNGDVAGALAGEGISDAATRRLENGGGHWLLVRPKPTDVLLRPEKRTQTTGHPIRLLPFEARLSSQIFTYNFDKALCHSSTICNDLRQRLHLLSHLLDVLPKLCESSVVLNFYRRCMCVDPVTNETAYVEKPDH